MTPRFSTVPPVLLVENVRIVALFPFSGSVYYSGSRHNLAYLKKEGLARRWIGPAGSLI